MTGYYFTHLKEIQTEQYPDNRATLVMADRFRGEVIMPHNDLNEHSCTGCQACEIACPNGTIKIITKQEILADGKKKKQSINLCITLIFVRCVIFALLLVQLMPLKWDMNLNTVYSINHN